MAPASLWPYIETAYCDKGAEPSRPTKSGLTRRALAPGDAGRGPEHWAGCSSDGPARPASTTAYALARVSVSHALASVSSGDAGRPSTPPPTDLQHLQLSYSWRSDFST